MTEFNKKVSITVAAIAAVSLAALVLIYQRPEQQPEKLKAIEEESKEKSVTIEEESKECEAAVDPTSLLDLKKLQELL